jgi:hypothetical protein
MAIWFIFPFTLLLPVSQVTELKNMSSNATVTTSTNKNNTLEHDAEKQVSTSTTKSTSKVASTSTTHFTSSLGDAQVLTERNAYAHTGYAWSKAKKWGILTVIFLVQISMNFNASVYMNAAGGIAKEYGLQGVGYLERIPQMLFLVAYAFGCELWAP